MQVHPMCWQGALAIASGIAMSATVAERSWNYAYTAQRLIEIADGPRTDVQDVTHYSYDAKGNLTQITNALPRLGSFDDHSTPGFLTNAISLGAMFGRDSIQIETAYTSMPYDLH
nr:hypothetical protein [Pseudomonas sp. GCEP-101]